MRTEWKQAALVQALRAGLCLLTLPLVATAQQAPTVQTWNVEAGSLQQAIGRVMRQGRLTISYPSELVAGKTTRGLSGALTPREALERLLEGSGIEVEAVNETSFVLRRADAESAPKAVSPSASKRTTPPGLPVGGQPTGVEAPVNISPVLVTGTRIRGGATPSPVITIGSEQIQAEGFTDLGEVIRSVPQNFTGGQNPAVIPFTISGAGIQNQNVTGGSGLNLRGLGPDASLTLLNGRRMSYGGFSQAVDITAIPVDAVERIEIVADGASAIYGSDAVGGVGNVILRRDYNGVRIGALYGGATDGGLTTREYTATAGTTWSNGGFIATYKQASVDPIYAYQRDYTDYLMDRYTIYPGSDLRSALISASQSLGSVAEFRLDALRTKRDQDYAVHDNSANAVVMVAPETTTSLVSPNIEFSLPNDWTISLGGSWSKSDHIQFQEYESVTTGQVFFTINNCYCNTMRMYEVGAEGPLFALPGGNARLAVGAGYRVNEYREINRITGNDTIRGDEGSRYAYVEANLPLIGPESSRPGMHRMALTAAMRGEDYDSFSNVTTPKLGVVYGPTADFTVKASWGKSYKAPTLLQRFRSTFTQLSPAAMFGGIGYPANAAVLVNGGGNLDLQPERARTWTTSLAFHPEALPGLDVELTWFSIEYADRVVQPISNVYEAMSNPIYNEFIEYDPSAAEQAALISAGQNFYNSTGAPHDPANVVAVVNTRFVNAVDQRIHGLDLTGAYRFDMGVGQMTVRGSASWLSSSQKVSAAQGMYDLAGTLYNPARLNSRLGAVWSQHGFSASVFGNHSSGLTNTLHGHKGASFTTFDATLSYYATALDGALSGLEFALSANNLFDRAPPQHTITSSYFLPPYDATNYSPVGRFLNLSVAKRW